MPAGAPDPTGKLTVNQRAALDEVRTLLREFHFAPTLYRLLGLEE